MEQDLSVPCKGRESDLTPRATLTASLLIASLLGAGCAPMATAPALKDAKRTATKKASSGDGTSPATDHSDETESETPATTTPSAAAFTGRVLGLDGQGAAGVKIVGYLVSNNGGGLVSNNGGGLISDQGSSFRVLSGTALETVTDAEGRFKLADPEGRAINIEAVKDTELKALRFAVPADAKDVTFQLAPTGAITGKVTAPAAPSVTNFQGVDVYVPGTGYMAKTDAAGAFRIEGVPVGKFNLYAEKTGLGTATASNVEVKSRETTTSPDMALSVSAPQITSVTPANGGPGTLVTVKGERFGATSGHPFTVTVGGVAAVAPNRVDDQTFTFTVPDNAGSGGVVLTVNQIASQPGGFQAISSLTIKGANRYMVKGTSMQLAAVAKDASGAAITDPHVQWAVSGVGLSITPSGLLSASGEVEGTIKVSSGTSAAIGQSLKLTVVASAAELPGDDALAWVSGLALIGDVPYVVGDVGLFRVNSDGSTTQVAGPANEEDEGPFTYLLGLVPDGAGNMIAGDDTRLVKVTPAGAVSTFAGHATVRGFTDGLTTAARFQSIMSLTRDTAGTMYCIDINDNTLESRLRAITPGGTVSTLTLTGDMFEDPQHIAVAPDGSAIYVENWGSIAKVDPSTGRLTVWVSEAYDENGELVPSGLEDVMCMAVSPDGVLHVGDGAAIRRIEEDGTVTTIEGLGVTLEQVAAMAFKATGELVVVDTSQGKVFTLTLP